MADLPTQLSTALVDCYRLERELGPAAWPQCSWPMTSGTSGRSLEPKKKSLRAALARMTAEKGSQVPLTSGTPNE
jgi:hypothetical protein